MDKYKQYNHMVYGTRILFAAVQRVGKNLHLEQLLAYLDCLESPNHGEHHQGVELDQVRGTNCLFALNCLLANNNV